MLALPWRGYLHAFKPQQPRPMHKAFKHYEPGYMDVKYLPQMPDKSSRRYLFVSIDRTMRWVFVQLKANKTAASAQIFLKALHKACPIKPAANHENQRPIVQRFNDRIAHVLETHRFNSREDVEQTLLCYVALYQIPTQLPQSALGSKTPMQAMKNWHQTHTHLFHKRSYDRPGCNT